ncbi:MAG: TetR family transcriptional regulator [Acidobacteria bacterium]|nr:TetR family transcriptional regulator [Acidobacteriota bacterium]
MGRWEPDARGRLEEAAMTLYVERGFEQTTVAEIAELAGLTERTFFRYFADKREVLFSGASSLQELMVNAVRDAPATLSPYDAIAQGIAAAGEAIGPGHDRARLRQHVIDANNELKERELIKMATLSGALAQALHERGVDEPTSSLAAEAGIAVFRVAFERWVRGRDDVALGVVIDESIATLSAITHREERYA